LQRTGSSLNWWNGRKLTAEANPNHESHRLGGRISAAGCLWDFE